MEKKIIIKAIDKLVSVITKDKFVNEYIIYYMINGNKILAYTELGDDAKDIRVNEIILIHFMDNGISADSINKEEIIEEISFENK